MVISKDIKFDCAHMLSNYEGKCANLHGHTYHGTVTLDGAVNPITGMLMDYNTIKKVIDKFDHAIIVSDASQRNPAEEDLLEWACRYDMRTYVMPHDYPKTTAENMAVAMAQEFIQAPGILNVHIRLSETDGSWAIAGATRWAKKN